MGLPGISTRTEALMIEDFQRLIDGLHRDGEYLWEMYCCTAFSLALRVSDVLALRWEDVLGRNHCRIRERKTKKVREIVLDKSVVDKFELLYKLLGEPGRSQYIFMNHRTGRPYTTKHINQLFKKFKVRYNLSVGNFATHSLRKTVCRHLYNVNGQTEHSVILLNRMLQHSSVAITMTYLGIRNHEIQEVYSQIKL